MRPIRADTVHIQHILRFLLLLLIVVGLAKYAQFQARNFIEGPEVFLTNTPEPVQQNRVIDIEGTTKNIVSITLNGRQIYVTENGDFHEKLVLESGYTIMTIQAEDRFGRTTNLTREFVYVPPLPNS